LTEADDEQRRVAEVRKILRRDYGALSPEAEDLERLLLEWERRFEAMRVAVEVKDGEIASLREERDDLLAAFSGLQDDLQEAIHRHYTGAVIRRATNGSHSHSGETVLVPAPIEVSESGNGAGG